jgi:YebC/PmpR family DNA-binding regulatory protein
MAGHSKWANIKHRKAATDAKRGKVFTKITKEIVIAARGGGDPVNNPSLRLILQKARAANMPNKNVERAIQRGTGASGEADYIEALYEGYGPHAVGLMIEVVTDNRNRAVAELRHTLSKYGGSMAEGGAVGWQFTRKGVLIVPEANIPDQDEFFLLVAEAGADDVEFDDPTRVLCQLESFQAVQEALNEAGIGFDEANVVYDPNTPLELAPAETVQVMKLIDMLEELDDVQNVYAALEISDAAIEAMDQ